MPKTTKQAADAAERATQLRRDAEVVEIAAAVYDGALLCTSRLRQPDSANAVKARSLATAALIDALCYPHRVAGRLASAGALLHAWHGTLCASDASASDADEVRDLLETVEWAERRHERATTRGRGE